MGKKKIIMFLVFGVMLLGAVQFGIAQSTAVNAKADPGLAQVAPGLKYVAWPVDEEKPAVTLKLIQNTSQVLRFDRPVIRIAISDPEVCDIETLSSQELLIYAKKQGKVSLIVWDENYSIAAFSLETTADTAKLEEMLRGIDPWGSYQILPFKETLIVHAQTDTQEKVKRIEDAVTAFDEKAVHVVRVRKPKLILLEVRFAEIDRKSNLDFGIDTQFIGGKWNFGTYAGRNSPSETDSDGDAFTAEHSKRSTFPLLYPTSSGTSDIYASFIDKKRYFAPYLQWLEQKNILKLIARPNLLTKDGEAAKFIVGGEFPIATTSFQGINVEYKEFGNIVEFTPEILENELIRLKVKAEVSELDFTNTIVLAGSTIPSILKRNQETVAVLKADETLVIGGMITQRISQVTRKIPILGDIPGIRNLFRRKVNSRQDVELLIIITPHLVSPFEMGPKKEYYNAEKIEMLKEAVRVHAPDYAEDQADTINQLITQEEGLRPLKVQKEAVKQIEAEMIMAQKEASTKPEASEAPSQQAKPAEQIPQIPQKDQKSALPVKPTA